MGSLGQKDGNYYVQCRTSRRSYISGITVGMDSGSEDKQVRLLGQDVMQLQKWKMIEYIVFITWETRRIVASKAQNFTDHWLVMTYLRLPHRKESWKHENN